MSFPRYPAYKASGVEWLGEVPEHWCVDRIKRSTQSVKGGVWGDEEAQNDHDIPCVRVADFDRVRLRVALENPTIRNIALSDRVGRVLDQGDLLLEKSGGGEGQPVGCVVLYDDHRPAVCSNFVARIQMASQMDASFWRYLHASVYSARINTRSIKQTSGIQNLDSQQYLDERVAFPPLPEQTRIAAFLDRETAKIDGLVAEQQRLIDLLKEKRQAVISHAVTKGLNPAAPMNPSGIEWLGDVPAHWTVKRYKHILKIFQGMAFKSSDYVERSSTINVRMGNIKKGGVIDLEHNAKYLPDNFKELFREYALCENDIIIAMTDISPSLDFLSVPAVITGLDPSSVYLLNQRVGKLIINEKVDKKFVKYLLLSHSLREQLKSCGLGTVQANMSNDNLYCASFAYPPPGEQSEISTFLDQETSVLDALTAEAQRAIDLLHERRTALISAAVTGQIDVRQFASRGDAETRSDSQPSAFPLRASAPPRDPAKASP